MQNGYIASFNGKFRDEFLYEHWFETLHQARSATAIWRQDYNEVRPHSVVADSILTTPADFALTKFVSSTARMNAQISSK